MSERTHEKSNWLSTTPQQDSALKLRRFTTKDDKDEEIQQSPDINLSKFSLSTNSPFPDSNIQRQELEEEKEEKQDNEIVQTKLTVGEPGDKYEQEADTVAAKVVEQINSPQTNQPVQGKVEPVVKPTVMRQGGAAGGAVNQDVEQNIQQARGSGQGLAENVRQPMEQAFGADFSGVKVHTDGQADVLNRSLNSRAFATGQDIFFKQGEYQPGSRGGQELLAHELTHVVQQGGGVQTQVQRECGIDESCIEEPNASYVPQEFSKQMSSPIKNTREQIQQDNSWQFFDNPILNTITDNTISGATGLFEKANPTKINMPTFQNALIKLGGMKGWDASLKMEDVLSFPASKFPVEMSKANALLAPLGVFSSGRGLKQAIARPEKYNSIPERVGDGISNAAGLFSSAVGTTALAGAGLKAFGATTLGGTLLEAAGATTLGGTLSAGATTLGPAAALAGAGAGGYALGGLLDKGVGGLMNWTGASDAIDRSRGITRGQGETGDYSPSGMIGEGLAAADRGLSSLWADKSKPAYTQTIGWKLADLLGI
ncbi:MAG: DUF4157 domain-containing protein [Cyanobacteria bacterium J06629_18]